MFKKSDQVFDSNKNTARSAQTAAVQAATSNPQVAAVQPQRGGGRGGRGGRGGNRGGRGGNSNSGASNNASAQTTPQTPNPAAGSNKGPRHATAKGADDKLCKIHYKWGENGSYCAAPWKCPMKDVYKSPQ